MLKTAAILNFILAAAHIMCMPWLDEVFKIYGIDGTMNQIASSGSFLLYLITVIIALCFALCAIYALSGAGVIRRLPFLWTGIFTVAAIFLFRACIGSFRMIYNDSYPFVAISSVVISGTIGLLYLIGGISKVRKRRFG